MENDMKVLCPVMMQLKMVRCSENAMAVLKGEAPLRTRTYKINSSIGIKKVCKMLTAILDTGAVPNLLKANCLLRALARHVVTVMATSLWSAANTHPKVKGVIPERPIETNNSQNQLSNSIQFGHWHNLRDGIYQWKH